MPLLSRFTRGLSILTAAAAMLVAQPALAEQPVQPTHYGVEPSHMAAHDGNIHKAVAKRAKPKAKAAKSTKPVKASKPAATAAAKPTTHTASKHPSAHSQHATRKATAGSKRAASDARTKLFGRTIGRRLGLGRPPAQRPLSTLPAEMSLAQLPQRRLTVRAAAPLRAVPRCAVRLSALDDWTGLLAPDAAVELEAWQVPPLHSRRPGASPLTRPCAAAAAAGRAGAGAAQVQRAPRRAARSGGGSHTCACLATRR